MPTVHYGTVHPYHIHPLDPAGVPRPLLRVRLIGQAETPEFLALVDSGADSSLFHSEAAQLAGIDLTRCRRARVRGVGGAADVRICRVVLAVEGQRFAVRARFSDDPARQRFALLGRHDVFERFRFGFDQRGRELLVEPYR